MSRHKDIDELIRQKTLLGGQVARKHPQYTRYVGASPDVARLMANIDSVIQLNLFPEIHPYLKIIQVFLNNWKIADFNSIADILTILAILVGSTSEEIDATSIVAYNGT